MIELQQVLKKISSLFWLAAAFLSYFTLLSAVELSEPATAWKLRIKTMILVDNRGNPVNTSSNKLKGFQKRIDTKSEMINSEPVTRHIPLKGNQTNWESDYLNEQTVKLITETGLASLQTAPFRNQRQKNPKLTC